MPRNGQEDFGGTGGEGLFKRVYGMDEYMVI